MKQSTIRFWGIAAVSVVVIATLFMIRPHQETTVADKSKAASLVKIPAAPATPAASLGTKPGKPGKPLLLLPQRMRGPAAAKALGANLARAASVNHLSISQLQQALTDETSWMNPDGRVVFADNWSEFISDQNTQTTASATTPYPLANTFSLHSNPGSRHTIYLDFVGFGINNNYWTVSQNAGVANGNYAPWSLDTNPAFSDSEKTAIQEVWARVAEDYAAFDVDVTTAPPAAVGALDRTSSTDQTYGVRVVFPNNKLDDSGTYQKSGTAWNAICQQQCGGVSTLGTIREISPSTEYFGPSWVFADGLQNYPKYMADAAAHEAGHAFGLTHDGTTDDPNCMGQTVGCSYYVGNSLWGPIMGAPYDSAVTQWSKGEYANANNNQDDLAVIAQSAPLRSSSGGASPTDATALPASGTTGIITSAADRDVYALGSCSGALSLTATPAATGATLDLKVELLDAAGNVYNNTVSDPATTRVANTQPPTASGMNAAINTNVASGAYYLRVSGGGSQAGGADNGATGFTSYASIGTYTLSGASGCTPTTSAPTAPTNLELNSGCNGQVLTWSAPTNTGNAAITNYQVQVDNGSWTSMGTNTTATFQGIVGSHTYRVRALNPTTGAVASLGPPGAISALKATYNSSQTAARPSYDWYTITWATPANTGGLPILGYHLSGGLSDSNSGVLVGVQPGTHPTLTVTSYNAIGDGPGASIALNNSSSPTVGAAPSTTSYTGTPAPSCVAASPSPTASPTPTRTATPTPKPSPLPNRLPSEPRSVRLVTGSAGGAITCVGSWTAPYYYRPAPDNYQMQIRGRTGSGSQVQSRLITMNRLSISFNGVAGNQYRISVRAHNAAGWGPWSAYTGYVQCR